MKKSTAKKIAVYHIKQIQPLLENDTLIHFYLKAVGIEPPKAANDDGFYARLTCLDWWSRRLIAKGLRDDEARSVVAGNVARGRQIYCSDKTVNTIKQRNQETLRMMNNLVCVSEEGDELDMIKVLQSSIANPENRRNELMVRMAGFEQFADSQGHVGIFYTITTPSKYHRFSGNGLNENYKHTPREGQKYLTQLWARIRAQFAMHDLTPYGFRVAEPHHDGTPHWHMLLFMPAHQADICTQIMREYALKEDGTEQGAEKHRFTAKEIVKEIMTKDGIKKVSATGYIAKYIAKNIGFDIGMDSEDESATTEEVSQRVRSWASVWGIRQFQQIGGASVTVWRELRRLKDEEIEDETIRQARDYCVANDWAGFFELLGGLDVKRFDHAIKPLKKNTFDTETGEIKLNRYQEIVEKIVGIKTLIVEVVTHIKQWSIIPKPDSIAFAVERR